MEVWGNCDPGTTGDKKLHRSKLGRDHLSNVSEKLRNILRQTPKKSDTNSSGMYGSLDPTKMRYFIAELCMNYV